MNETITDINKAFTEFFLDVLMGSQYLAGITVLMLAATVVRYICTKYDDKKQLFDADNSAVGISAAGYYLAFIPVMAGIMIGDSYDYWVYNVIDFAAFGSLAIVYLNTATVVNDKFILSKFSIEKELVVDGNDGTAWVLFGNYVATGWVIFGAIQGEPGELWNGIVNSFVYFALGQLALIIGAKMYGIFRSYKVHDLIEKDNVPAGMDFGGYIMALGTVIGNSGDLQIASDDIALFAVWSIFGAIVIRLFGYVIIRAMILVSHKRFVEEIFQGNKNAGWMAIVAYQFAAWALVFSIA